MEDEIWKQAPGLDGRYEVSNLGRARHISGRIRKLKVCNRGYVWLSVSREGRCVTNISMARLICEAFNGPPTGSKMDCDHKNRKRDDNHPSNLRWVTRSENLANRICRAGRMHHSAKLTEESVRTIRTTPFRRRLDSELAEIFGVSRETIRDVRLGKVWRHVQ